MTTPRPTESLHRLIAAILLATAPLLVLGGLEDHVAHGGGPVPAPVFAAAVHGGETGHLEAASTARLQLCTVCLAPAPGPWRASAGPAAQLPRASRVAARPDLASPPGPAARPSRPRAPPSPAS